ncbi:Rv0361 family membrane protein [Glycomyces salinus]|uniref:Rv0361 family membrane protein n=1 Tax=Glycomyces salinus TaxID=980294 RepID=UPI0018ED2A89|nr:DUF4878 domain-containing protein [Glycomyces salinus]
MDFKLRPARLTALTGGAFAMAFALAACGGGAGSPEDAVEDFLGGGIEDYANSFAEGDFDAVLEAAEEHLCAEDVEGLEEMAAQYEELSPEEQEAQAAQMAEAAVPDDYSYEIGEVTEDGDTATVNVELTAEGETVTEGVDVVKEDDEWKVCGFGV